MGNTDTCIGPTVASQSPASAVCSALLSNPCPWLTQLGDYSKPLPFISYYSPPLHTHNPRPQRFPRDKSTYLLSIHSGSPTCKCTYWSSCFHSHPHPFIWGRGSLPSVSLHPTLDPVLFPSVGLTHSPPCLLHPFPLLCLSPSCPNANRLRPPPPASPSSYHSLSVLFFSTEFLRNCLSSLERLLTSLTP